MSLNYFKCYLLLLNFIFLESIALANTLNPKIKMTPYDDITVGAIWNDWQNYPNGRPLDLVPIANETSTDEFVLAFLQSIEGKCKAGWAGISAMSVDSKWGKFLTDKLTENNKKYSISIGGANGLNLAFTCEINELLDIYENIYLVYHPNGLDFDIEGSFQSDFKSIAKMLKVIKKFQINHSETKITFTLATMPEGLTAEGEWLIKAAKSEGIHFIVNIMAMDYGYSYNQNMADYAIQAANNLFSFLKIQYSNYSDYDIWQMIAITPMIGLNDVTTENFSLHDADKLKTFANQFNIGGLHLWSVKRDNPCSSSFVLPICSSNNNQKKNYEYLMHFNN